MYNEILSLEKKFFSYNYISDKTGWNRYYMMIS